MQQWSLRALCFSTVLVLCQLCARAYLVNTWTAREWASGFFTNKCHRIPKNMTLCYGIGYEQMRLPNLLNHESVDEAVQQSNIWNLLDKTKCHDDLRIFLCSLYAPVCLKEGRERQIIKPCRSLCHLVRDNCVPRMRMFGYEWPAIARCDKFPDERQNHLCIPPREQQKPEKLICRACDQAITFENIISSYCMAKVVLKGKMKSYRKDQSIYFLNIHKKRRFYRSIGLSTEQKRTIVGELKRDNGCVCPKLREAGRHDKFLIMGERDPRTGRLNVKFLTPWQRRNRPFRRATRAIRKRRELCRRQRLMHHQTYNINQRRQQAQEQQRRNQGGSRRPSIRGPLELGPGDSALPLPGAGDRSLPQPVRRPLLPRPNPAIKGSNERNSERPSRPTMPSARRGSQRGNQRGNQRRNQRGNQRENRRENQRSGQRQGRRRNGRRRKNGQRGSRKRGRGRGRGSGNKGSRNRDSGDNRKRKRKRKRKIRRNYYSMAS